MTQEAVVTNSDDIIIVDSGSNGIYINPSKGHDVVDFSRIFYDINCIKVERVEGTRDLKIYDKHYGYSNDYVIIKDYFTSDAANATNSSVQTIRVHGIDYSINEFINYTGGYTIKKGKVKGTQFNDVIDYVSYELKNKSGELIDNWAKKGLTINAGAGNDRVIGTSYSDTISVTSGKNYINAFYGNNKITLGTGEDTVYHEFDYVYWNDTIVNSSANDKLDILGCCYTSLSNYYSAYTQNSLENVYFIKKGNDLAICYGFDGVSSDNSIILKGYFKQDAQDRLDTINYNEIFFDEDYDYINDKTSTYSIAEYLTTQRELNTIYDMAKNTLISIGCGKVKGVNEFNNYLCGSSKKDTIIGGTNGNLTDYIDAGRGKDKIVGGAGRTILKYVEGDGKDNVYLSEGENFTLKYVANDATPDMSDFSFKESGDDLIITRKYQKEVIKKGKVKLTTCYDKIVFKNFNNADSFTIDLYSETNGGIYGDIINSINLYQNGENGIIYDLGKEGAKKSVKLYGTDLNERIFGSKKSDIIYSGGGFDIINAGSGNDKIYLDDGVKSLKFGNGSGNDTVYINSGDVRATLVYDSGSDLSYSMSEDEKDLIITNTYTNKNGKIVTDTVTIKDFYTYDDLKLFIQDENGLNSIYRYLSDCDCFNSYTQDELAMLELGVDNWQNIEGAFFDNNSQVNPDDYNIQCYITQ